MNIHLGSTAAIPFCFSCQYGKLHQQTFSYVPHKTTHPFQIIHTDIWGPSPFMSIASYKYYVSLVDDYSRFVWIYSCKLKSEVAAIVTQFISLVERQFYTKIKCIQSDWGGEYRSLLPLLQ